MILLITRWTTAFGWLVDRLLGVETGGFTSAHDLGLVSPDAHGFAASPWLTLRRVLPPSEVGPEDVFLDVGAGKGRMVLAAALAYPFHRVIGVEMSPELAAVARSNVVGVDRRLRCRNVVIETGDVGAMPIVDDVTVIYAYDPFEGDIFARLVGEIFASVDRRPRTLRLIYRAPQQEANLVATGRARLVRRAHGLLFRWDGDWPPLALFEIT